MVRKFTGSRRKPTWLVHVILATLALSITALPTSAASPQAQDVREDFTSSLVNTHTMFGDTRTQGQNQPDAACPSGGQCFTDVPSGNPFYAFVNRIYQQDLVTGYPCGGAGEPCDPQHRPYYRPINNVTRQQMAKFIDNARHLPGIDIEVVSGTVPIIAQNNTGTAISANSTSGQALTAQSGNQSAIYAQANEAAVITAYGTGSTDASYGVYGTGRTGIYGGGSLGVGGVGASVGVSGTSPLGTGVHGGSTSGFGVEGSSDSEAGVHGDSGTGNGVEGISTSGYGLYAVSVTGNWAGYFGGNINVTGSCTGCLGSSKIDDPLDPANKYLYHSAVQSPDMMDIYNGNVTTDANGDAVVTMPTYFEALNRDYRYQLTVIGQFAQAIVSEKMKGNHFVIKTDKPNVEVSWQVTGIRQDAYSNAHRAPVEEDKPADEKGKYLHPTESGQSASLGVDYEQQQKMQQAMATESKP